MSALSRRFIKQVLEFFFTCVAIPFIRLVGRRRFERIASHKSFIQIIQFVIRKILKKKNRYFENNIERVLGISNDDKKLAFQQEVHKNIVHSIFDSLELDNSIGEKTTYSGLEHIQNQPNGCLFLSIHMGSYEVGRKTIESLGIKLYSIMNTFTDAIVDPYLFNAEHRFGHHRINAKQPTQIVNAFRGNNDIGALIDLKVKNKRRSFNTPFCGQGAWTSSVLIQLAQKHGKAIIPYLLKRNSDGSFHLSFYPAIADEISEQEAVTQLNDTFSDWVMADPANWMLWDTNRWGR